jgi:hypothetical protein
MEQRSGLKTAPHTDDDEILYAEPLPPVVPPGEYIASISALTKATRFQKMTVDFTFQIVTPDPKFDVRLPGYGHLLKNGRPGPRSKLMRWMRLVQRFTGEKVQRVSLRQFGHLWYRVAVEIVTHNHEQR